MRKASISAASVDPAELPAMLATLCSYENLFGPYHPQTLFLTTEVANVYWQIGEPGCARPLLERVVRDSGRWLAPEHDLRLRALTALRDLLLAQREVEKAGAVQREILECRVRLLGGDHAETHASRAYLAAILLAGR